MGGIPGFSEALDVVLWLFSFLWENGKKSGSFIVSTFPYHKVERLFILSLILLVLITALFALLLGGGVMAGGVGKSLSGSKSIDIGSNSVASSIEKQGTVFKGSENTGDSSGPGNLPGNSTDGNASTGNSNQNNASLLLCGNGLCESFNTSATYRLLPYVGLFPGCPVVSFYYDVPTYCLNRDDLPTVKVGGVYYPSAICGNKIRSILNSRCFLKNNSVFYIENYNTCPSDCTENVCYKDFTCLTNKNNCNGLGMQCCGVGTINEGQCVDISPTLCNDISSHGDLSFLQRTPYHCPCSDNGDCLNDFGGNTCCTYGIHKGFCHTYCDF